MDDIINSFHVAPSTFGFHLWMVEVCQEIATSLGLAPGAVLFRGPLVDALEVACPGHPRRAI